MPAWSNALGAQLEICSDRACTVILQTVAATGCSVTLPADLSAGTVFWRLRTRTASAIGPGVSPTWVLYVEPGTCPLGPFAVRTTDYDGDGQPETVTVGLEGRRLSVSYSTGALPTVFNLPEPACNEDGSIRRCSTRTFEGGNGLGDVTGDGYGDIMGVESYSAVDGHNYRFGVQWSSYLGGVRGITGAGPWSGSIHYDRPPPPAYGASATGDIDRDGYGDVLISRDVDDRSSTGYREYRTHFGAGWSVPTWCAYDRFYGIDINGDAIIDAAIRHCPDVGFHLARISQFWLGDESRSGFGAPQPLPGCVLLGASGTDAQIEDSRDTNCDGFSDIIAHSGTIRYVLLGGSDGLSDTRCMALPATP